MDTETDGLTIIAARRGAPGIETALPAREIADRVASGAIVLVKGAFDPEPMRRVRNTIAAWQAPPDAAGHTGSSRSFRLRRESAPGAEVRFAYDNLLLAVENAQDEIGPAVREPFARLAAFWRALTGCPHGFTPGADGLAVRPWAMYFPRGGGHMHWHTHPLEPQKVGMILALSEYGVDYRTGETQFRTPAGIVGTGGRHDIGDLCLFRNDLAHRVTEVDPDCPRHWDGSGRWTLTIPLQANLAPGSR